MAIRNLLDRFYRPKTDGFKVFFFGLDCSGKTTLLYKLALGQVVTTIPTIGFNVETVKAPTTSGRDLTMTGWDVGPGCGGAQHMIPLVVHLTASTDAIIWVVDSVPSAAYTLDESAELLGKLLRVIALRHTETVRKDFPILILANKQDNPGAIRPFQVHNIFAPVCQGHVFSVFPSSATQDISIGGLPEAFNWLLYVLEHPHPVSGTVDTTTNVPVTPSNPPSNAIPAVDLPSDKLGSWITRAEEDSTPEEFLSQFESISLPAWDHYTHIRIAYTILTTHGRQKGKNMIFDGIERYIAKSTQTRGRTFHITMTYFWIQIVHFGIRSMPPLYSSSTKPTDSSVTLVEAADKTEILSPALDDFSAFLMLNPYVMDGNLWAAYYSKDVMMSPEAKSGVVLPDKKPLPNLVVRDAVAAQAATRKR